jgi:[acyl-carrier-protein] S-malonyltransferase
VSLAFLFPGQGAQKPGMGRALAEAFPASREVFERADAALGSPLSKLCWEGPERELGLTANTQPAVLVTSLAALAALRGSGVAPEFVAGHSLGEYSALVAAGVLELEDAVVAVRRRGEYMQEAVPVGEGAMAAVLKLDLTQIEAACRESAGPGQVVAPANINSAQQVVIAGHAAAVARAGEACKARGAKRVVPLPVSAPFHCELMAPARERLRPDLERLSFRDPRIPVITNVDAAAARTGAECRDALLRQVASPVRWLESMRALAGAGVRRAVELGPGSTLVNLMRQIAPEVAAVAASDPESAAAARKLIEERA